ncbi:hypothetical protein H476_2795 [[Clostridium] sordellii VPI 9048]|nr:hypothetical protein H476_2795 [[Clostridium] sordellii VPI 9048] [Paeniclostridium sordellii VPI 9048]
MKKYVRNMKKDIEKMKKVLYHIKYKEWKTISKQFNKKQL